MTTKQKKFCDEYILANGNGAEAARRAGYKARSANGTGAKLLANAEIRAEIDSRLAAARTAKTLEQAQLSEFLSMVVLGDIDAMLAKLDDVEGTTQKMADTQLNNLSGDLIRLGSAWDAFQQSFFEGQAGEGLRNFTQALTDVVTRANELFKDGIQIKDVFSVIGDIVGKLRDKFLQFDGIGSLLAGGALMAGLLKIGSTIQKVIGYFKNLRGLQIGSRLGGITPPTAKPPTGLPGALSVSTMHVSAGVVNISGRVSNGVSGSTGGANGGSRRVGDLTIIDRYNRERERIRGAGTSSSTASRWAGMKSAAKGGAAFAAIFGALDFFSTRSNTRNNFLKAQRKTSWRIIRNE